jgi:hypothetical protein
VWPDGIIGSISHKADVAIALVAQLGDSSPLSIGVDLEYAVPSEYDLGRRILTSDEESLLRHEGVSKGSKSGLEEGLEVKLRFSIKVCDHMTQRPVTIALLTSSTVHLLNTPPLTPLLTVF